MEAVDLRPRLLALLRQRAVLRGDFVLASGKRSSHYLDARLVTLSAEGSWLVGKMFLDLLEETGVDAVAGLTLGADPIVAAIATVAGLNGVAIDGLIVRKEAKEHGTGKRIEGPWRDGVLVAVVEDTSTTGGSAMQAVHAVEDAGGRVGGVYALIDREQGARETVEKAGHRFHALFRSEELL